MKFETFAKRLGKRLTAIRRDKQMTQAQLARDSGLSLKYVSMIEQGTNPSIKTVFKVCEALACMRTASIAYHLYFAEGYCSLLAFRCDGSGCDSIGAREIGNVDTFTCPAGYASVTREEVVFGNTITSKTCHPTCNSHSQCRWNAVEDADSPFPGCSQYACTPRGGEGEFICLDVRNP